jgi:hypothetical protein
MSNRIDFFEPAQMRLTLPGAVTSVLLEGSLCPFVEVVEVVRCSWQEFGWAKLAVNQAAYPDVGLMPAEEVVVKLSVGKRICIRRSFNSLAPGAGAFSLPIFYGYIECTETKLGPDGEEVKVIAKDFSAHLRHMTVYGQRVGNSDGSTVYLSGADTIFNPDGEANATIKPVDYNGDSYTMFAAEPSAGRYWSYVDVIDYLLCEYLPTGQLHTPNIEQLRALIDNQVVRDLDVTGLNLLDALQRCCERIALEFKFVPRLSPTGPEQAIVFYRSGQGRTVELNCQRRGERFSISKTSVARLHSRTNFWPVTHKYIGQGDFKVYEATFDLVKAWDPAAEDTNYEKFSASTNSDFYQVKDVYRKWCLNEAGDYSGPPYNQGDAFNFSKIFESSNFVHRRRRFWPMLTTDKRRKSLVYFLEVSFDNGLH